MKTYPSFTDGTEACLLNKSDLSWFDFVINRLFMKLFKINNIEIVELSVYIHLALKTVKETCQYIMRLDSNLITVFYKSITYLLTYLLNVKLTCTVTVCTYL